MSGGSERKADGQIDTGEWVRSVIQENNLGLNVPYDVKLSYRKVKVLSIGLFDRAKKSFGPEVIDIILRDYVPETQGDLVLMTARKFHDAVEGKRRGFEDPHPLTEVKLQLSSREVSAAAGFLNYQEVRKEVIDAVLDLMDSFKAVGGVRDNDLFNTFVELSQKLQGR